MTARKAHFIDKQTHTQTNTHTICVPDLLFHFTSKIGHIDMQWISSQLLTHSHSLSHPLWSYHHSNHASSHTPTSCRYTEQAGINRKYAAGNNTATLKSGYCRWKLQQAEMNFYVLLQSAAKYWAVCDNKKRAGGDNCIIRLSTFCSAPTTEHRAEGFRMAAWTQYWCC